MNISIEDLTKVYPNGNKALDSVNLEIGDGMFGLLGPNGAGKTTLMQIMVTMMMQTGGVIKVNGQDIRKNRKNVRSMLGYLPQEFDTFPNLKTGEFLDYTMCLAGVGNMRERAEAVDKMLDVVGLGASWNLDANKLSGGMKRRLGIAQALISKPKIVIVDEPTTGLDPEERIRFRNLLSELSREEIIIILSTHIVADISSTCTNMAMLNKGKIIFNDSPDKLLDMARGHVWVISALDDELEAVNTKFQVVSTVQTSSGWEIQVVADSLDGHRGTPIEPNLEHAYVYFMNKQ